MRRELAEGIRRVSMREGRGKEENWAGTMPETMQSYRVEEKEKGQREIAHAQGQIT